MIHILVVDDDPGALRFMSQILLGPDREILEAGEASSAMSIARSTALDLAVIDVRLGRDDGIDLFRSLQADQPDLAAVFVTGFPSTSDAVRGMRLGAFDFLEKPASASALRRTCDAALATRPYTHKDPASSFEGMIGSSAAMTRLFTQIAAAAATARTVLVRGETGTGKELVARAIHSRSCRSSERFVAINVAAMPSGLLEAELFGHERGAFTGADAARAGIFEHAARGTLFLDEIGDLAPELQVKLLRAIESHRIARLGSHEERLLDVRVVAATNADLLRARDAGTFRPDLYYRLRQIEICLPPLRDRGDDIALLTEKMLAHIATELQKPAFRVDADAMAALTAYSWPGNVRELEAELFDAAMASSGTIITTASLSARISRPAEASLIDLNRQITGRLADLEAAKDRAERLWIVVAMRRCGGSPSAAADMLGIDRKTLYDKRRRYGLLELGDAAH